MPIAFNLHMVLLQQDAASNNLPAAPATVQSLFFCTTWESTEKSHNLSWSSRPQLSRHGNVLSHCLNFLAIYVSWLLAIYVSWLLTWASTTIQINSFISQYHSYRILHYFITPAPYLFSTKCKVLMRTPITGQPVHNKMMWHHAKTTQPRVSKG